MQSKDDGVKRAAEVPFRFNVDFCSAITTVSDVKTRKGLTAWNNKCAIVGVRETWDLISDRADGFSHPYERWYHRYGNHAGLYKEVLNQLVSAHVTANGIDSVNDLKLSFPGIFGNTGAIMGVVAHVTSAKESGRPSGICITHADLENAWHRSHALPIMTRMVNAAPDGALMSARCCHCQGENTLLTTILRSFMDPPLGKEHREDYVYALLQRANLDGSGLRITKSSDHVGMCYRDGVWLTPAELLMTLIEDVEKRGGPDEYVKSMTRSQNPEEVKRRLELLPTLLRAVQAREAQIDEYRTGLLRVMCSALSTNGNGIPILPLVQLCHSFVLVS